MMKKQSVFAHVSPICSPLAGTSSLRMPARRNPQCGAQFRWRLSRMQRPLEITSLTKAFVTPAGPYVAVKDFRALIQPGEFVSLLGHSGCGKSTVLSIVAGLEEATEGGVVVDGKEIDGPGLDRALVFQSPSLLPWMSAL